ncbi:MAG TPA: hypothetical protein VIL48_07750 [Acidimicrobiales bacterium]
MANRRSLVVAALAGAGVAVAGAALALAVVVALGFRSSSPTDPRNGVAADTARFTYGERRVDIPLLACAREGDVVIMAGREGSVVVQVRADVGEGGRDRTGVTVDLGDEGILGAFGPDLPPGPAGEIVDVEVVGDALIVSGRWTTFDENIRPLDRAPDEDADAESLIARCPADEDVT